jgi:hypothetical protein
MSDFKIDLKESAGSFVVTPIETQDGLVYQIRSSLLVRPYPNPTGFGGYFGLTDTKDKAEVDAHRESFKKDIAKYGIINVEIKENPVKRIEVQLRFSYQKEVPR